MYIKQPSLKTENSISLKSLQGVCFYIIAFNLLWAYFEQSFFTRFFSIACFLIFGMTLINIASNLQRNIKVNSALCYVGLALWSLVMIGVYGTSYSPHSTVKFLFFSMDGAAIFFIRLFVSVLPCMVFVDYDEFTMDKKAKAAIFIVLATSVFFTSKAVATNPDALRARGTMEYLGLEEVLIGTPGYAMTYAYALLTPVFLHKCCLATKKTKVFYGICLAMLLYIVVVAQYATALLITIAGILAYILLVSKPKTRVYIVLSTMVVGSLIWATNGGSEIFYALAENVEGTWSLKLRDIALTLEGQADSGSVSSRAEHYAKSLDAFMQSPIFGMYWNTGQSIGGHATAIDVLGLCGIMGFIPMMLSLYGNFARMKNYKSYQTSRPAAMACMIEFIILIFTKNIVTSMAVFFVFYALIPLLLKAEEDIFYESAKEDSI